MKRSKSNPFSCALFALGLVFCIPAANASLILYDFNGGSTMSTDTDANSTASAYSANPSLGQVSSGTESHFARASLFPSINTETTLSDFSVAANPGYVFELDSLDFSYGVTGGTDSRTFQYRIYTDVDSYTTAIFDSGVFSGTAGNRSLSTNIDLTGVSYDNLSSIAFRVRGQVSDNSGSTTGGNNIMRVLSTDTQGGGVLAGATDLVLNGRAVPEPSTFGFLGIGIAALVWHARPRRRLKEVTAA